MSKKAFLWINLAAIVVTAFAAPSGASALMLYYEGKSIEKAVNVEMVGSFNWTTGSGSGIDCSNVKTIVDAETNDAKITTVVIDTTSCKGTGAYANCKVIGDKTTGLPWTAHLTTSGFTITDETYDYELLCAVPISVSLSVPKLNGEVNNFNAIKSMKMSGTGTSGFESATVSGEFEVLGEPSGKLSIAE